MRYFLFLFFFVTNAFARVEKINLNEEKNHRVVPDLFSQLGPDKIKKMRLFEKVKYFENHARWKECADISLATLKQEKDVRGWVALTALHCHEELFKNGEQLNYEPLLDHVFNQKELFDSGPWVFELQKKWAKLRFSNWQKNVQDKKNIPESHLEELLGSSVDLTKDHKALAYQWLGDAAQKKGDLKQAQQWYEISIDLKDSPEVWDKLKLVKNDRVKDLKLSEKSGKQISAGKNENEVNGPEVMLEEKIRQALIKNQTLLAMQDLMGLLGQYPGSRLAKRLKDKPLEIIKNSPAQQRSTLLSLMLDADDLRMLEWAQALHKAGDYESSSLLAKKFLSHHSQSSQATSALWIAGRSAHFLGRYEEALQFFGDLQSYHDGTEEAQEAQMRSAIINLRLNHDEKAIKIFEQILKNGAEKYELSSRYWYIRALQRIKSDKVNEVIKATLEKYPFSYFGLRLRAEQNSGKLNWPVVSEKSVSGSDELFLFGAQTHAWHRLKKLADAGWVAEAQAELAVIPLGRNLAFKMNLAQWLARRKIYFPAIRMISEITDKDVNFRKAEYIRDSFPKAFSDLFNVEANRYGVHPVLLLSLTRQESGFNVQAISASNAMGLMQMIPPTAEEIAAKLKLKIDLPSSMFRPEINIPMGSFYVSQMLEQFGNNVPFALASYNAGPHRIKNWIAGRAEIQDLVLNPTPDPFSELWYDELPWGETSFYVKAILRNTLLYRLGYEGNFNLSPVLWQDLVNKKSK